MYESPTSPNSPGPDAQDDKPGRSLVIVNETTNIILWLLPSPARARRACPLPDNRERDLEMDTEMKPKKSQTRRMQPKNDSLKNTCMLIKLTHY
jgi:hypothetical protein